MLKSWIAKGTGNSPIYPSIAPDVPFYLIGDVHGRSDLLGRLLSKLVPQHPVVLVGDYVDRGEESAGVLRQLFGRPNTYCIKGNHEDMLLSFLENPIEHGPRWLRYGGLQTLASFGIAGLTETSRGPDLEAARDALRDAMGSEMIFWLRTLPLTYVNGNVGVVHAAADPRFGLEDQKPKHLLWGHPEFGRTPRRDGMWIAHGHTIIDEPQATQGIIAVDTGAYATGKLTVAGIGNGAAEFLTMK
ncbi:metallophosphoesterase family protein [Primorskyibacter sp. S87]|uniref:metallophosphoesterase family protein n=1 Tax=Primorskyibacter sp. S87 TaxID=3415126 RepID=UPI003C7DF005